MSVTINVNNLSLCHKGSNGISTATLPDVCKTPSPGGPVPMPYPNVSMSSDLASGTTTVTADGGNMIAIKGSEFSRSTGDEPGTVGGLKSNVNMKASKWLLYSFDVKFDGANACRLTDKKTQNNENTVDAGGEVQTPLGETVFDLQIDCDDKEKNEGWDDPCMREEVCAKVKAFNALDKSKFKNVSPSPSNTGDPQYSRGKRQFAAEFAAGVTAKADQSDKFLAPCRHEDWKKNKGGTPKPNRSGDGAMSPDHVHDVHLGGSMTDMGNLKWVDSRVNVTLGGALQNYDGDRKPPLRVVAPGCCSE